MRRKICTKCSKVKQVKEFYKDKTANDGYQSWCKDCKHKYNRLYWRKNNKKVKAWDKKSKNKAKKLNPEKYKKRCRNSQLKYNYNITLEEYNVIFEKQNGCCLICGHHQHEFNIAFAVDHCHKTGEIRGLLCSLCNLTLGRYEKYHNAIQKYLTAKDAKDVHTKKTQ